MDNQKMIKEAASRIKLGKHVVFFTGAGISTESGIPDYRSKGGIWKKFQPVYFQDFMASRDARIKYWQRKSELYQDLMAARPNLAHQALVHLRGMDLLQMVITQNIDGLHQLAGLSPKLVVELHGNTMRVRCMSCNALSTIKEAQARLEAGDLAPECSCGGYLKPDTISFGQSMPVKEMELAHTAAENADVFVVIGSTLLVQPAASLPVLAKQRGACLIIINLSETPCDGQADILIRGKAGEVLPAIVKQITV